MNDMGGYGKYQYLLTGFYALNTMSSFYLLVGYSYLTVKPDEYICTFAGQEGSTICTTEDFCTDDHKFVDNLVSVEPNMDHPNSYHNLIE